MSVSARHRGRRGGMYVYVLVTSMLLMTMGVGSLMVERIAGSNVRASTDWTEASELASSAIEFGISGLNAWIAASPATWRTGISNGQTVYTGALGDGAISLLFVDEVDNNFTNNYTDPFRIIARAQVGVAKRALSVQVRPAGPGLDVLRTACHAKTAITSNSGHETAVDIGPLSTDGNLNNKGTINGAIEAGSLSNSGTITGSTTVPSAAKTMPPSTVFDDYKAIATTIPTASFDLSGNLQPYLLSAGYNPYGAVDPNGIYYALAPSTKTNVALNAGRLQATLLLEGVASQSLQISNLVFMEPYRPDCPTLIVRGFGTVRLTGDINALSEAALNVNLNPASTPYNGVSNSTKTDVYPTELRGLIHVLGSTTTVQIRDAACIRGCLLVEGTVNLDKSIALINDKALLSSPPVGYASGSQFAIVQGSWRWEASP